MNRIAFAAIACLFATPAYAVKLADCPQKITVSYLQVEPLSDTKLHEGIIYNDGLVFSSAYLKDLQPIRDALQRKKPGFFKAMVFEKTRSENDVCGYTPQGNRSVASGNEE